MSEHRRSRLASVLALAALASAPAAAGSLDLDLYGTQDVRFTGGAASPEAATAPGSFWVPGNPRDLREEPKAVQIVAETGYTTLGAAGAAQAMRGAGGSRAAKAESAGFVAVALVSFWRLIQSLWN